MKIETDVLELWTQSLQGQLSAEERQQLWARIQREDELREVLLADADIHQGLLDHYAAQPGFQAIVAGLPLDHSSLAPDRTFVQKCLAAAAEGVPSAGGGGNLRAEMSLGKGATPLPPLFDDIPELDGASFEPSTDPSAEPASIEPTPVQPPPFESVPGQVQQPTPRSGRWVYAIVGTLAALLLLTLGVAIGQLWSPLGQFAEQSPATPDAADTKSSRPDVEAPATEEANKPSIGEQNAVPRPAESSPLPLGSGTELAGTDAFPEARQAGQADDRANPAATNPFLGSDMIVGNDIVEVGAEPDRLEDRNQPLIVRGRPDDSTDFIKDPAAERIGPSVIPTAVGQLTASGDAQWDSDPRDWRLGRGPIELRSGVAELVLGNGVSIRYDSPARFELRSEREFHMLEGEFFVASPTDAAMDKWQFTTDAVDLAPESGSSTFVSVVPDFGTRVELKTGQATASFPGEPAQASLMSADGQSWGNFISAATRPGKYPAAAATVSQDGKFQGAVIVDQVGLPVTAPTVFQDVIQVVANRLQESPNGLDKDWRQTVDQLQRQHRAGNRPADLPHEVLACGDLWPANADAQNLLRAGLPANGPDGGPGFDGQGFGGQGAFFGKMNINGQEFDLTKPEDLRRLEQMGVPVMGGNRRNANPGNGPRRNPAGPDAMVDQMLELQQRRLEFMAGVLERFGKQGLQGFQPGEVPRDPVVATFMNLLSEEGRQDWDALWNAFETALQTGLETEEQRRVRLEEFRQRLHQPAAN